MILTVTINPLLEKRLYFEKIEIGKVNRSTKEIFTAGGKGININRQLNKLGIKNQALTFVGGNNGKKLRHILGEEGINTTYLSSKAETRSATLAIEEKNKQISSFFSPNAELTRAEVDEIKSKLEKMMVNCSIVVFSGSSVGGFSDEIFSYGIELAHKMDKFSIVDTYGTHLTSCIQAAPSALHNNVEEIESSLGIDLSDEKKKIDFLHDLYSKGIKLAFLTDGTKPAYASKFGFIYKINPLEIDTLDSTGSGDSFTAGICFGLEKALVFDDFVKFGTALGALNATSWNTASVDINEASVLKNSVTVESIGKKMKIIDDSPNY